MVEKPVQYVMNEFKAPDQPSNVSIMNENMFNARVAELQTAITNLDTENQKLVLDKTDIASQLVNFKAKFQQ